MPLMLFATSVNPGVSTLVNRPRTVLKARVNPVSKTSETVCLSLSNSGFRVCAAALMPSIPRAIAAIGTANVDSATGIAAIAVDTTPQAAATAAPATARAAASAEAWASEVTMPAIEPPRPPAPPPRPPPIEPIEPRSASSAASIAAIWASAPALSTSTSIRMVRPSRRSTIVSSAVSSARASATPATLTRMSIERPTSDASSVRSRAIAAAASKSTGMETDPIVASRARSAAIFGSRSTGMASLVAPSAASCAASCVGSKSSSTWTVRVSRIAPSCARSSPWSMSNVTGISSLRVSSIPRRSRASSDRNWPVSGMTRTLTRPTSGELTEAPPARFQLFVSSRFCRATIPATDMRRTFVFVVGGFTSGVRVFFPARCRFAALSRFTAAANRYVW